MKASIAHIAKTIATVSVFCLLFALQTIAQQFTEYEVKAAFLCNFAKFVEWPETKFQTDTSAIIIGIYGEDPFGDMMKRVSRNAQVGNRKVRIKRYEKAEDAYKCHILFVGKMQPGTQLKDVLTILKGTYVLTVSERDNFCQSGGMINFSKKRIKYGFEINARAAKLAGLKISAKLLTLAEIVE